MLTQARLKEFVRYEPETGYFFWIARLPPKLKIGHRAGSFDKNEGYRKIRIDGGRYKEHRLAWLYVYGNFPEFETDHINGIKDDNRICNLRDVSKTINLQNIRNPRKNNKLGLLGVSRKKGYNGYKAQITVDKKIIRLGLFDTPELAHDAYLIAKRQMHVGNQM